MQKSIFSLFCSLCLLWLGANAQSNIWTNVLEAEVPTAVQQNRSINPEYFQAFQLNMPALQTQLAEAPMEYLNDGQKNTLSLNVDIPMPDGRLATFEIQESPVMMPRISQRYPNIRSYKGYASHDRHTSIRFVVSPLGFHASLRSPQGEIYIDPFAQNNKEFYQSYFVTDYLSQHQNELANFKCGLDQTSPVELPEVPSDWHPTSSSQNRSANAAEVVELRVYRTAIGATGEWTQKFGGTVEGGLASMNISVARLNLILENEAAIRLVLIDDQDKVIFPTPSTDPYTSANEGRNLLGQNTQVLNDVIGESRYDFGHVYTGGCTDVGGVANLGSICGIIKGAGVTCFSGNNLDAITTQIAAHEMGHQLGSNHTFNNCGGNENFGTGYEPGGGSTIMSYAGLCGSNSFQGSSDNYYHVSSLVEIYRFSFDGPGYDCPAKVVTNNHFPEISIPRTGGFYIPKETPFELTAEGKDEDGDDLTYNWEQFDKALTSSILGSPQGSAPLFRSVPPNPSPTRVFPRIETILNNSSSISEVLPAYSRGLTFRCIVRDNNPEGGVATWDEISFNATEEAGPFLVSYPNAFESIEGGSYKEITWDVANTDKAPVNCKSVDILLSEDGGYTYPYTLATAAKNDGSHFVYFPDIGTTQARVKIKAHNNVFFDLSNRNFQVYKATAPGYTMQMTPYSQRVCDPNIATFEINSTSYQNFSENIDFTLENLPPNAVVDFSKNPIQAGENSTLVIDLTESNLDDEIEIQLIATIPGVDTVQHDLTVDVVSVDFSDLILESPSNGASAVPPVTSFSWALSDAADIYDIEVSYSPLFDELAYSDYGLTAGTFEPNNVFEKNVLVYWRVRPHNECGPGPWSVPSAFHTENFDCSFFLNENINVPINKTIGTVVESNLFISENGSIEDFDIDHLDLSFAPIGGLDLRLISPSGKEVILMKDQCANTGEVKVTFDDEALSEIECPPNSFKSFRPQEPLSAFDNEDIGGEWKLRIEVTDDGFTIGRLNSWNIETCAGFEAKNPYIVVNELLPVRINDARKITQEFLEVKDDDNTATELTYVLVEAPKHGTLSAYGGDLTVGSTFLQDFIYGFGMKYTHNGNDAVEDAFYFTVTDGNGGFIGVTKFEIDIDAGNPTVGTYSPELDNEFRLVPNPAQDFVSVQFAQALRQQADLRLYDLSGRELRRFELAPGNTDQNVATADLTAGVYLVQLHTGQSIINKKLIVVR